MNKTVFHVCTHTTKNYIENCDSDLIVLIIPFSDPIAEENDIQILCTQSLHDGFSLHNLFQELKTIKKHPKMVFKTYANVIYSYGKDRFISLCKEVGISGLIIPDIPFEEKEEFIDTCIQYQVSLIPTVASNSLKRIKKVVPTNAPYVYLSCRVQDDQNTAIEQIKKHTSAYIIKR